MTKHDTSRGLLYVYPDYVMFVFVKLQQNLNIIELSPPMILLSNLLNEVKKFIFNKLFLKLSYVY